MPPNFEHFTRSARQSLTMAQEEARRLNHSYIGTEHVLLGLMRAEEGLAARVMAEMGLSIDQIRTAVERVVGSGARAPISLQLLDQTKRVIEMAMSESRQRNHPYIGTEHLLMAIARLPDLTAAAILQGLDINLDAVYERLQQAIAADGDPEVSEPSPRVAASAAQVWIPPPRVAASASPSAPAPDAPVLARKENKMPREAWSLRHVYLYLVCLITLVMCIIGVVNLVRSVVELAYPQTRPLPAQVEVLVAPGAEPTEAQIKEQEAMAAQQTFDNRWAIRNAVLGIVGNVTMLLVAGPLYLYHWRKIERERAAAS